MIYLGAALIVGATLAAWLGVEYLLSGYDIASHLGDDDIWSDDE